MELLLNLSWLVIALASVFMLRGKWRQKSPSLRKWVALATFLFLLFPVISLTDDLHPEIALAEAATGKKHFQLLKAHGPDSQPQPSHFSGASSTALQNRYCPLPEFTFTKLIDSDAARIFSPPAKVTSGRSPPSILL